VRRYGKPVYITENGIATADDTRRERYLTDILSTSMRRSRMASTSRLLPLDDMDNFEWARGYTAQFG